MCVCVYNVMCLEFIEGVSQFSVQGEKDKKLKCKSIKCFQESGYPLLHTCIHYTYNA